MTAAAATMIATVALAWCVVTALSLRTYETSGAAPVVAWDDALRQQRAFINATRVPQRSSPPPPPRRPRRSGASEFVMDLW